MLKQFFSVCSLSLCIACPVKAISNIENERPGLPEDGLSGNVKVSLNGKTGNQQEQSLDAAFKGFYRSNDNIYLLLSELVPLDRANHFTFSFHKM